MSSAATQRAVRWNQENSERRKEIARAYYYRHREKILLASKKKNASKPKRPKPAPKGRDPEKTRLRQQRWLEKNRDKQNAAQRARRAANIIGVRAKEAVYRKERATAIKAAQRRYDQRNPEAKRALVRLRRARKRGAIGNHTAEDINRIRDVQRDRCAYCRTGLSGGGSVDHIIALSKGGSNWPNNLQLLCTPCNSSKHNRDPIDFARSRGRLL